MINTEKINEILGIDDIYKAPEALLEMLYNKSKREAVFNQFLKLFNNKLDFDYFHQYFQDEAAERKKQKQDFTPMSVSSLISQLVESDLSYKYFESAAGTGGMMIAKWSINTNDCFYVCEELSDRAFPFLLFNMAIRGINGVVIHCNSLTRECYGVFKIKNRDNSRFSSINLMPYGEVTETYYNVKTVLKKYTPLVEDDGEFINEPEFYNAVVMNPPYSAVWGADDKFLSDPRFERYGRLAPKSKADFAFLLHGFYHLNEKGTMGIVLPHGVLFRGSAEGIIRKTLLGMGAIDAVIGLPPNIFYGTSIPTVVLILKKKRTGRDVLFIDASNDYEKQKNQNNLRNEDIAKIVDAYKKRKNISKYAHVASFEEIAGNDYNLNIPRYVDTFEEEEQIDIVALSKEMIDLNKQIRQSETEFLGLLNELAETDETRDIIEATKRIFIQAGQK